MEQTENKQKTEILLSNDIPKPKNLKINMPLSSTNKFTFNSPNYLNTLFTSSIGNDVTFNSPFGKKSIIYSDFTASGRGLKEIENFISNQILPFYANIHSSCGYLAEQSTAFRNEAKSIVRRYCNTDENNSIIFTGQGTTGAIHKLIRLLNLKEYIQFYEDLKALNDIFIEFFEIKGNNYDIKLDEKLKEKFEKINKLLINKLKENFRKLFQVTNFCYTNRWGGFDCILCRMGFTTETQYNEHEKGDIHQNNLKNFKNNSNIEKSKMNFIDTIANKYLSTNNNENNYIYELIKDYDKFLPIIFLSIYEHNSNSLSWRETGAKIIYINSLKELKLNLDKYKNNYIKMGSFTAASNITGKYLDIDKYSILMHKFNGLAFFDYAAAAPYIKMDMNKKLPDDYRTLLGFTSIIDEKDEINITEEDLSLCFKDALFFSPHKFLGGVNTPGVLLIQQRVVRNLLVPSEPGGGVVLFVTKNSQNYVKDIELREESGTPDIIGSVRVGLSLILRERIDHYFILKKEQELNEKIFNKLKKIKNLHILSDFDYKTPHIPIFSFLISFKGKLFHPNYISALLNDIFGIQSRPGCSCASTYGQFLLGINDEDLKKIEQITCTGKEIFRQGYTRMNFPYFYPDYVIDYLLDAIIYIANNAYKFLPLYAFKIESGRFYHRNEDTKKKWLNDILFNNESKIIIPDFIDDEDKKFINKERLDEMMKEASELSDDKNLNNLIKNVMGKSRINLKQLFEDEEKYRWFLIYDDIEYLFPKTKDEFNNKNKIQDLVNKCYEEKFTFNWGLKELYINKSPDINIINNNNNEIKNVTNKEEKIFKVENDILNADIEIEDNNKKNKKKNSNNTLFPEIPKKISQLVGEASKDFDMLHNNDRVLVCVSGGKDSLTLLHVMLNIKRKIPFKIDVGAVTVDPMSEDFDPSPLINYMKNLGVPYFFESDKILDNAKKSLQNDSICSFCARMKRGIIYNCARREKYNVIALGQHLDDIAESFLMSVFHNGLLRTMKANYTNDAGDIRIIRPLIYCREKLFKDFALKANLPVIQENCPACFQNPKERQRMKVLLAQQENLFPSLFSSLQKAMFPLMKGNIKDLIIGNDKDKEKGKKNEKKTKNDDNSCCYIKGKKFCSVGDEFDE